MQTKEYVVVAKSPRKACEGWEVGSKPYESLDWIVQKTECKVIGYNTYKVIVEYWEEGDPPIGEKTLEERVKELEDRFDGIGKLYEEIEGVLTRLVGVVDKLTVRVNDLWEDKEKEENREPEIPY